VNPAAFSVRNWQFTLVVFALMAMMGLNAWQTIPRAEDPTFPVPVVIITVTQPGSDPTDLERLVVDPIERVINGLDDVNNIKSTASDGVAVIAIEFSWDSDPEKKYDEAVREVNALRPNLPQGVRSLVIDKVESGLTAISQIALVSETASYRELEEHARDLKDAIDRLVEVRQTIVSGVPKSEVRLAVDLGRLAALGIPVSAIERAVQARVTDIPGGALHAGERRFNLKTTGSYKSLTEIEDTVIAQADGKLVRVRDVANVAWDIDEPQHLTAYNGKRAVFINTAKKNKANVFQVRDKIFAIAAQIAADLPADIKLEYGFDQSRNVDRRLSRLAHDFLFALGLVAITLLPLGLRAAGVVMISIPLSLAIGLAALNLMGYTLNQLSIAGFVLALGLLVDDSIVVVENIARHLREGMARTQAAIAATEQIAVAVLGCTATLMLAFLPLLFLPEGAGQFIRSLPVTVLLTIAASLFVAMTIIPFLASRMLSEHEEPEGNFVLRVVMGGIHAFYRPLLHLALGRPWATLGAATLLFGLSISLIPRIGFSLFPPADSAQFLVAIETPDGSSLAETGKALGFVDKTLRAKPQVKWVMTNLGASNPRIFYNQNNKEIRATRAEAFVELDHFDSVDTPKLYDALRREFATYPGAQIVMKIFENGPPIEAPIAIRIVGKDIPTLHALAADVARAMEAIPGIRDVGNPVRLKRTDFNLGIDTAKAASLGISPGDLDHTIRLAFAGSVIGQFRESDGAEHDIVVRLPMDQRHDIAELDRVFVATANGGAVPLSAVIEPRLVSGPSRIDRYKRERAVTITAYADAGFNVEKLTQQATEKVLALPRPPGYQILLGGQAEASAKSFAGLSTAILVAIFGILAVLVLEFASLRATAVVAGVIPLGLTGGLAALWVTGYSLSFTAIIGIVALIGIEIKNSILLVDFTNQLRREGVDLKEAIERAGEIRFLPVLLTSATAIGGLLPLALAQSGLYSPLAWVIIGGLVSSTFLSRLVTPVMYFMLTPDRT
jgi:multidrug efflux pump subunit AcrB